MASLRELRGRIKSVGNIKQITRAMEMVATTKLRRFQDRAVASRPYAREIAGLVSRLAAVLGDDVEDQPLFRDGAGDGTALLFVTSDRGLCGAYNSNVQRKLEEWLGGRAGSPVAYYVIGRKGYQYLHKRGREVEHFLHDPPLEQMDFRGAARIATSLMKEFLSGRYKDVCILYSAFESMAKYVPTLITLLPVRGSGASDQDAASGDVILEPDPRAIFDAVVPRYVETTVFNALLEAITSEYASRRLSMKNATDAATDMQGVLKSQYNRRRQESITKDLLDIVGGAEALR